MVNFVRPFIKDYAEISAPLVRLTGKYFVLKKRFQKAWGTEEDSALARVKRVLPSAHVLHFPYFSREFVVHTDASELGSGAFLAQPSTDGKYLDIIAYFSRRFSKANVIIAQP